MADVLLPLIWNGSTLAIPQASATQDGYLSRDTFVLFSGGELVPVTSFNNRTGEVILWEEDVLAALGYVPLNKHGDTMTGQLRLAGPPIAALDAATRGYVDSIVGGGAPVLVPGQYLATDFGASGSGAKFTGGIAASSNQLTVAGSHDFEVGHGIFITGAGPSGADLLTKVDAIAGNVITLHVAASTARPSTNVQHDDTVALQNAINIIVSAGGGTLKFPTPSYYRVNGPFGANNSILTAPFIAQTAVTVPLGFEADNQPFPAYQGPPVTGGCVIQSDKIGATAESAILAFAPWSPGLDGFSGNNITFTCKGITWRTYPNPQMSALDLRLAANCILENLLIDANINLLSTPQPTHAGTFGLALPCIGAGIAMIETRNVYVLSYDIGCWFSEMWHSDYISVMRCNIGLKAAFGYHISTGWALIWHCPTGIEFVNRNCIRFVIDFERRLEDGFWDSRQTGRDIHDPTGGASGRVEYLCIRGGTGGSEAISTTTTSEMSIVKLAPTP